MNLTKYFATLILKLATMKLIEKEYYSPKGYI